jgi:hypothetical protein
MYFPYYEINYLDPTIGYIYRHTESYFNVLYHLALSKSMEEDRLFVLSN